MSFEDGVATARWVHQASNVVAVVVRREVTGFARRHGMVDTIADDVAVAVAEVVPYAADGAGVASPVVVEAATDGQWLSVRIAGEGDRSGRRAEVVLDLPLVLRLAHRFEYGTKWQGSGTSVLMEFPMRSHRGVRAARACDIEAPRRRPLARARSRSH